MTIDEVMRRIVWGHAVLLAVCLAVPVAIQLVVSANAQTMWSASVRIQVNSSTPTSSTEAEGVSSRVLALATTPQLTAKALEDAGVSADPGTFAEERVTAQRLGESAVVELTVTDSDRSVAAAVVSSLADQVTAFMNRGDREQFRAIVTDLDTQIAAATKERAQLDISLATEGQGKVGRLNGQLGTVERTLGDLYRERAALTISDALRSRAVAVAGANPNVEQVPSSLLPRTGLALVLGLVIGLTLAAAIETLRPNIPSSRSLSNLLDAPLLGSLQQPPEQLAVVLARSARRKGVSTVVLLGAGGHSEALVAGFTSRLPAQPGGALNDEADMLGAPDAANSEDMTDGGGVLGRRVLAQRTAPGRLLRTCDVTFTVLADLHPWEELAAGVVLVAPGRMPRAWLDETQDAIAAGCWPLLGVLESGESSRAWSRRTP